MASSSITIDKDTTARINLGILVSIIATAVGGAMYLQSIEHAVTTTNTTLREVKIELEHQNGAVLRHSELLIRQNAKIEEFEHRLRALENK